MRLLARCLGVVFTPYDEDYGYVTLESFLASKPVITCTDSGGPVELVEDGVSGWVTEPDPRSVAEAIDRLGGGSQSGCSDGSGGPGARAGARDQLGSRHRGADRLKVAWFTPVTGDAPIVEYSRGVLDDHG